MWQRAKIVDAGGAYNGKLHWVKVAPPDAIDGQIDGLTLKPVRAEPAVETNIIMYGQTVLSPMRFIELLPEFADTVKIVSWEDFEKDQA